MYYPPGSSQSILFTISLSKCQPLRMVSMFFICLCLMALCGNTLNQTGNITHLSCACFTLGYLDWSLCGQKPLEQTENIANLYRARVPQRHLECFCCLGLSGNTLKQTENITHLSYPQLPLVYLGMSLRGESKCGKPMEQTGVFLICFGVMITLTSYLGFLLLRKIRG